LQTQTLQQSQPISLASCLTEVTQGVGAAWKQYRILGATRGGLALGKEAVGKHPERYKPVMPGTIFYNPMRIRIGSIAMLDEGGEPGITSPDYVVVRCRRDLLHPKFFYYWLRSTFGADFIRRLARGAVRERMLFSRLSTGEAVFPNWEAQSRFAGQISIVEKLNDAVSSQTALTEVLTSVFRQSGQSSIASAPRRHLGDLVTISARLVNPTLPEYHELPHINGDNIETATGRLLDYRTTKEDHVISSKFLFPKGSILYSKIRPYLRKAIYAPFEGLCSADVYPLGVDSNRILPEFLLMLLLSDEFTAYADSESRRTRMPKLNRDQLLRWLAPCPSLEAQQELVEKTTKSNGLIAKVGQVLNEQQNLLDSLARSLLQSTFVKVEQ
jgi:restriction endonuclease S subunit